MENWYVMQVLSGHEEKVVSKCNLIIDKNVLYECFIPYVARMKKYKGKWHQLEEALFKGYVFLICDDIVELYHQLKQVPELTKMLGRNENEIIPLKTSEINFLKRFGKDDHFIDMSIGYIEGDVIRIIEGPLLGKEGMIKKIDRHKRIAYVEVDFLNQTTIAKIGLEIISKNS